MSLLNNFFFTEPISSSESGFHCALRFEKAHPIFSGHFPGMPVVPGVCSVEIVHEVLQEALHRKLQLLQSANIKFLRVLGPDDLPELSLAWKETAGIYQVQATMKLQGDAVFKMQAQFGQTPEVLAK